MSTGKEVFSEVGKATPPGAVVAVHALLGIELNEWLTIITIIYVLLQIFFLIKRHVGIKQAAIKVIDASDGE